MGPPWGAFCQITLTSCLCNGIGTEQSLKSESYEQWRLKTIHPDCYTLKNANKPRFLQNKRYRHIPLSKRCDDVIIKFSLRVTFTSLPSLRRGSGSGAIERRLRATHFMYALLQLRRLLGSWHVDVLNKSVDHRQIRQHPTALHRRRSSSGSRSTSGDCSTASDDCLRRTTRSTACWLSDRRRLTYDDHIVVVDGDDDDDTWRRRRAATDGATAAPDTAPLDAAHNMRPALATARPHCLALR